MRELNGHYQAEDLVSVWIGNFPDEAAFVEYLKENWPDDKDEDNPIECAFWKDLGITWHDHDFQEAHFEEEPVEIGALLRDMSFSHSYTDAAQNACKERDIEHANSAIVIFEYDYPTEANFQSEYLTFIGAFPYSTGDYPFRR